MSFQSAILPILASAAVAGAPPPEKPIVVVGQAFAPFISPMGEPFRSHGSGDDTLADWFKQADRNHDGYLTVDEMEADADRFFDTLDTDHDGKIDPDELTAYEWQIAPEIQVNSRRRRARGEPPPKEDKRAEERQAAMDEGRESRTRADRRDRELDDGPQGAGRYSLFNMPEPVAAADANFDRIITREEFRQAAITRFLLLDVARQGKVMLQQLRAMLPPPPKPDRHHKRPDNQADTRVGEPFPPGN